MTMARSTGVQSLSKPADVLTDFLHDELPREWMGFSENKNESKNFRLLLATTR